MKEFLLAGPNDSFHIYVHVNEAKAGEISSDLHESGTLFGYARPFEGEGGTWNEYNAAIDGLEALILAHACAGIDIMDSKYQEGIVTAVEAISNNCGA
jgi:hypothetical protein